MSMNSAYEEVFGGLSNPWSFAIENVVQQALTPIKDVMFEVMFMRKATGSVINDDQIQKSVAVQVAGLDFGIGSVTLAKCIAKRAMDFPFFDILLWMIGSKEMSRKVEFQMEVAEKLRIPFSRDNVIDDGELADETLAAKIHACLHRMKFLLVHDERWELKDLRAMGIPFVMSPGNYSMVLVTTRNPFPKWASQSYHKKVSIDFVNNEDQVAALIWEESNDISHTLSLRRLDIPPKVIMDCIFYTIFLHRKDITIEFLLRCWFAEGFIGGPMSDLDSAFTLGTSLLRELQERHLIYIEGKTVISWWTRVRKGSNNRFSLSREIQEIQKRHLITIERASRDSRRSYLYLPFGFSIKPLSRTFLQFSSILQLPQPHPESSWNKTDRIHFDDLPVDIPIVPPEFPNLSTIVFSNEFKTKGEKFTGLFTHANHVRVLISFKYFPGLFDIIRFMENLKLLKLSDSEYTNPDKISSLKNQKKLEILDFSSTSLENLRDDTFEGMQTLRLLDLSNCKNLTSLPSSISSLLNLEQLLLGGCCNLSVLPSSMPLEKLQMLDLSNTKIVRIPDKFFEHMLKLNDLNLAFASHLTSLPMSFSNLFNIKKLRLLGCTSLVTVIPSLRQVSSSLEELSISLCSSLKDRKNFPAFVKKIPNLRVLNLESTDVQSLSFKNCSNLETTNLSSAKNLEVLDLSATNLKRFPLEDNPNATSLRCLYLLGVTNLRTVDWKVVNWLPPKLVWVQYGDGSKANEWYKTGNEDGVFISVDSTSIFQSLAASSPLWTKYLSHFSICVQSGLSRGEGKAMPPVPASYKDIYQKYKPCVPLYQRFFEVGGGKPILNRASGVLSHTDFFYLHDERNVVRLPDAGIINMEELKECWLERCHSMEVVFDIFMTKYAVNQKPVLCSLEKIRISNLKKLRKMCVANKLLKTGSFSHLKNLHIEFCPRLVNVFSACVSLKNLEVMEIKFCARLEEVFTSELKHEQDSLARLHTLVLSDLPALKSIIRNVELLNLTKARITGCPNLRELPICTYRNNSDIGGSVVVTGEQEWWNSLKWEDNNAVRQICFKNWKPLTLKQ